jgi:hypothetical protein
MNRGVAQLASVLAWGASGRVFESHRPDYKCESKRFAFFILTRKDTVWIFPVEAEPRPSHGYFKGNWQPEILVGKIFTLLKRAFFVK